MTILQKLKKFFFCNITKKFHYCLFTNLTLSFMAYKINGLNSETAKLQKKLEKQLPKVNMGRIKFIVFFIFALLTKCTVVFYKLASVFLTNSKILSNH